MNTLKFEADLAKKFGYKKLPPVIAAKARKIYEDNIPEFLNVNGGGALYTLMGTKLCDKYDRIVIGDYGAFIEYSMPAFTYSVKNGQEYRINDPYYSARVKYEWYTVNDSSNIKIYKQKRGVTYADYRPGKYYVSVHEVTVK